MEINEIMDPLYILKADEADGTKKDEDEVVDDLDEDKEKKDDEDEDEDEEEEEEEEVSTS